MQKYKNIVLEYLFHIIILLVFWGGMIRFGFNADTLSHMVVSDADIYCNLSQGRYVVALLDGILLSFGLRTTSNVALTIIITLLIFALSMLLIQKVIVDKMKAEGFYKIIILLAMDFWAINVLFSEILMFSEICIYSALAYLMGTLSISLYVKKKYFWSTIFLIVAVCTYQYVAIFVAIIIAFNICISSQCKITKKVLIEEIVSVFVCVGVGAINLASMKTLRALGVISEVGKKAGTGDITEKINKAIESFVLLMKHSYAMIPANWIPAIIWGVTIGVIGFGLIKKGESSKLIYILIIVVSSFLLMYVIPMSSEKFFFPPRMAFIIYLLYGFLVAYGISELDIKYKDILTVLFVGFLIINLLCVQRISGYRYVTNTLDEVYAKMIDARINRYEEETGNSVKKIAISYDEYAPFHYAEVNTAYEQINESASYSVILSLMKEFTGRTLEKTNVTDEVYKSYFAGKDWNHFDLDEQVVIIEDTVYWCLY